MKLETFFEKFALFADAPGAEAKMRELVVGLAVQGKLFIKVCSRFIAQCRCKNCQKDKSHVEKALKKRAGL